MGVFSKYHRFREAGEEVNVNNAERFGMPERSLFTTTKVFTLHHHIDVTDDQGVIQYQADTKFPSIHDKTDIRDAEGRHVAHVERKLFTLHERHFITMADGIRFELSNELFHLIKDITNIEGLGWRLQGNIAGLNFELYDEEGKLTAVIGQKFFSVHDKYCVDIYNTAYEPVIITILITLQHMIKDRQAVSSAYHSGSSSTSN